MDTSTGNLKGMPGAGLEPACPKTRDFKTDLAGPATGNPWQAEEESRHFFPCISAVALAPLCPPDPGSADASGPKKAQPFQPLTPREIEEYARQDGEYRASQLERIVSGYGPTASVASAPLNRPDDGSRIQRGPGERHEQLVARLVRLGAKSKRFHAEVEAAFADDLDGEGIDFHSLRPDAFTIDTEDCRVIAYEVSITHALKISKLDRYVDLWDQLSDCGIYLEVAMVGWDGWARGLHLERRFSDLARIEHDEFLRAAASTLRGGR